MKIDPKTDLYDVVSVNIKTGRITALLGEGKTLRNAEAIMMIAVARRGVNDEFYKEVPAGLLKVGDHA